MIYFTIKKYFQFSAPTTIQHVGSSVAVPRADDETFTSFFTSASQKVFTSSSTSHIPYNNNNNDVSQLDENMDLDVIDSGSRHLYVELYFNKYSIIIERFLIRIYYIDWEVQQQIESELYEKLEVLRIHYVP